MLAADAVDAAAAAEPADAEAGDLRVDEGARAGGPAARDAEVATVTAHPEPHGFLAVLDSRLGSQLSTLMRHAGYPVSDLVEGDILEDRSVRLRLRMPRATRLDYKVGLRNGGGG